MARMTPDAPRTDEIERIAAIIEAERPIAERDNAELAAALYDAGLRATPDSLDAPVCHQHGGWHHHAGFEHSDGPQHPAADHRHEPADSLYCAECGATEPSHWPGGSRYGQHSFRAPADSLDALRAALERLVRVGEDDTNLPDSEWAEAWEQARAALRTGQRSPRNPVPDPCEEPGCRLALGHGGPHYDERSPRNDEPEPPIDFEHDLFAYSKALRRNARGSSKPPEPDGETWAERHGWAPGSIRDEWNDWPERNNAG